MRLLIKDRIWIFRGHNSVDWTLTPKLGRPAFDGTRFADILSSFQRRALEFIVHKPEDTLDWITLAQHHGLPTPLLDWSYNPLVAAFFAVSPVTSEDCAIYAHRPMGRANGFKDPLTFEGVAYVRPRGIAARVVRQSGVFTLHGPASCEMGKGLKKGDPIHRYIITKKYRKEMIYELDRYGINRMTLFPDLDGLSSYMDWSGRVDVRKYWSTNDEA